MPSTKDMQQVDRTSGEVKKQRRFDQRDWKYIADYVIQTLESRKKDREDIEKQWKEIDRQVAMKPSVEFKKLANGQVDSKKRWMAETELPLQAQALEVLTSDSRRMMFPDSGPWFGANVKMTDELLEKLNFESIILGDKSQVPTEFNQDNCDKIAEGFLNHCFRQYDHAGRFDQINAESFKYGMGVGRARLEKKNVYIHESRGVRKQEQRIPVIVPATIKNTYLDNPKPSMHSNQVLGAAHIWHDYVRYENLALAANKGSNDPEQEDGGWMPSQLSKVEPDKNGYVQVIEMEGDIIIPRKTVRSVVVPGAIITVAVGGAESVGGSATRAVVRLRFRRQPFSSYLLFPYHFEGADQIYPTSPLMKGRTVQSAATDALNRFLDSAMLKNAPPVGYDPSSPQLAQMGGPAIEPYGQWPCIDPIKVYIEVGGDPSALMNAFGHLVSLYAELTGVLPARLGAQTRSHTTAYAKGAEIERGATRTVDYVNAQGHGPITRWLDIAYQLGRGALSKNQTVAFFIEAYGGFVEVTRDQLPDEVEWDWFGSGGPQEKQQKAQAKMGALQAAVQIEVMRRQLQMPPRLNLDSIQDSMLREGGWTDLDAFIGKPQGAVAGPQAAPMLPGPSQGDPNAGFAALQDLTGAGG